MRKFTKLFFTFILSSVITTLSAQNFGFQWVKQIGGPDTEQGLGITVDAAGNIYHTGNFNGTCDFDPGAGTVTLTSIASGGGYVSKLDASGNFSWAVAVPGTGEAIATDASGNVFITGIFSGTQDFDPGAGTTTLTPASTNYGDAYICKFDNAGNFLWVGSLRGIDMEVPESITTDGSGNVFISGNFKNTCDFDPNAGTSTMASSGTSDGFILKLDNSGNYLWAAKFGSSVSGEESSDAVVDAAGNVYITGVYGGTVDFDPSTTGYTALTSTSNDVYIVKLDGAGNFLWVKGFGSFANDECHAIALDANGNIYIGGSFAGTTDFDPSATGTTTLTAVGVLDCFISKFDAAGNFVFAKSIGSSAYDTCKDLKVDGSGNICFAGIYSQTADFNPDATGTYTMASTGTNDAFMAALDASGSFLWAGNLAPWSYDFIKSLALNSAGDLYFCGSFLINADFDPSSTGTTNVSAAGGFDAFILKLNHGSVGIKENQRTQLAVSVYPNPSTDHIILQVEETGLLKHAGLTVYDVTGKEVKKETIYSQKTTVDLSALNKGVYFYQLSDENRTLNSGKIIVQ